MSDATVTVAIPTYNRAALLREALESVLAQTHSNFRLVIGDNASTDNTADVVASYCDTRIEYVRSEHNIGMIANFNRLIGITETEFLMLLPDDDLLYPDYLNSILEVLQRNLRVGFAHTAFDVIDIDSRLQKHAASFLRSNHPVLVEPGRAFLERSMTSGLALQSSITFRTRAIREAGGMTTRDEPLADVPLFMRIAMNWDIAYLDRPLVAVRDHDQTETVRFASRDKGKPNAGDRPVPWAQMMFDRRIGFLDEAGLPSDETNRYRSLATFRFLVDRAGLGAPWLQTWADFARIVRFYPRILTYPIAWRFIAAQCGARAVRRATYRLAPVVHELSRRARRTERYRRERHNR
jgi:glycosyltransferase involved in cell wall biosynthesis